MDFLPSDCRGANGPTQWTVGLDLKLPTFHSRASNLALTWMNDGRESKLAARHGLIRLTLIRIGVSRTRIALAS